MARLDVELEALLVRKALYEQNPAEKAYWVDPEMQIRVTVQFNGDLQPLIAAGFSPGHNSGSIAHGRLNPLTLEKLNKLPSVISIEKQPDSRILLDKSIPDIAATNVWSRTGNHFHGYSGLDVVIGIIDTGIDFRHKNFIGPNGKTRIKRIWDQTIFAPLNPPVAGETAPVAITTGPFQVPLGYGVEYTETQINNTLEQENPPVRVRHVDQDGHGSHVAGIAAGNGAQAGGCHGDFHYIGVAPRADLVVVRVWGLTKGDRGETQTPPANPQITPPTGSNPETDALRYVLEVARTLGKPVVINCSFGAFGATMNGTDGFSQDVDTLLNNNAGGRCIVIGAGNDGKSNFHAAATVPPSGSPPLVLEFQVFPGDSEFRTLAIVYTGTNLDAQVISPIGGANGTIPWVSSGNNGSSNTANGPAPAGANGVAGSVVLFNSANRIALNISPPTLGTPPVNQNNVANTATAKWRIELRNTGATPTQIDAFCIGGSTHDPKSIKFLNNIATNSTLTSHSSGRECISVGGYKVGGQLYEKSSKGPTMDGRTKPELCAPGVDITSAAIAKERAGDCANCCCECCQDWYVGATGTSMAAPHITGVVALMLHKNPNLTHTDIKTFLISGCNSRPGDAPPADITGWGAGKVSALNSVSPVGEVNPPVPMIASQPEVAQPLLVRFLNTEFGNIYYALGKKNFREIFNLINTNKRVATAWHRSKGPVWTRLALTAFHNPEMNLPAHVHGMHFRESVDCFISMLKRYASIELNSEIERCMSCVSLVKEDMTLSELMNAVGNHPIPVYDTVEIIS